VRAALVQSGGVCSTGSLHSVLDLLPTGLVQASGGDDSHRGPPGRATLPWGVHGVCLST
jgi:hypothetical protein